MKIDVLDNSTNLTYPSEIREYADAVLNLSKDIFPATFKSYLNLDS